MNSSATVRSSPARSHSADRTGRARRAIASPTRIPVTASNPISVANVARRSGVRSEVVAAISAAISAWEYR
jgi:hypothetical protein